jgi:NAD(P)-dependent dehydrogenase (short-subunit alcohol dehydrogenase family)
MIARTGTRVIAATSLQHIRPIIGARHTTAYYFTTAAAAAASDKTALVIGSSGALGSAVSKHLKDLGMQVLGADVVELPSELTSSQWELDGFCPLPADAHLPELTRQLVRGVNFFLKPQEGFDAIVVASGGWQADPDYADLDPGNEQALEDGALEYAQTIQSMRQKNLDPVLAAGYVAQHYASANSLVVVMGATAALGTCTAMDVSHTKPNLHKRT